MPRRTARPRCANLAGRVDLLLVVGAANSSNSNRLQEIGAEQGVPCYLIPDAAALRPEWLRGAETVGITAGASAPESLVQDVIAALGRLGPVEVSALPGIVEDVAFKLPAALVEPEASAADGRRVIAEVIGVSVRGRAEEQSDYGYPAAAADQGRRLRGQAASGRAQALPAGADAGAVVQCNLACSGCGKIDYPDPILNKRLSVEECLDAVDQTGVPVVAIAGGEPLLHKEMPQIVEGILAKGKVVILCTNALLLEKRIEQYKPHPNFTWDIHLDGDKDHHDWAVSQKGVYERAVAALKDAKARGFRVAINATLFDNAEPERMAKFFDDVTAMGVDAIMVSPGYAYERAPDQQHFLNRKKTKELFRGIFSRGKDRGWKIGNSPLFVDFLAGNQTYHCTPWGNPTRNIFGWQRPCYLLGEGYAKTFAELMDEHRLGQVRRRQLREMRRLHGPFGLRGDRGHRQREAPLEGDRPADQRAEDHRRDGARDRPLEPAEGGFRLQPARRADDGRDRARAAAGQEGPRRQAWRHPGRRSGVNPTE